MQIVSSRDCKQKLLEGTERITCDRYDMPTVVSNVYSIFRYIYLV